MTITVKQLARGYDSLTNLEWYFSSGNIMSGFHESDIALVEQFFNEIRSTLDNIADDIDKSIK